MQQNENERVEELENVYALLRVAARPKRIFQKDMSKTIDYYENMVECFDPCLFWLPHGWEEARKIRQTVNRKACARNKAGVYRLGVSGGNDKLVI